MALTKTLQGLIERAERKGEAIKRVREGMVMGSGYGFSSYESRKNSPMIEQWKVTVIRTKQDGMAYKNVIVDHYETQIAHIVINETLGNANLHSWYGESNSDRDALNGLCSYYNINAGFRYRPSKDLFEMIQ